MSALREEVRTDKQELLDRLQQHQQAPALSPWQEQLPDPEEQREQVQQICHEQLAHFQSQISGMMDVQQQQGAQSQKAFRKALSGHSEGMADLKQRVNTLSSACHAAAAQTEQQGTQLSSMQAGMQQQLHDCQVSCSQDVQRCQQANQQAAAEAKASLKAATHQFEQQTLQQQQECRAIAQEAASAHQRAVTDEQQEVLSQLKEDCRQEAVSAVESWLEDALQPAVQALQEACQQSMERIQADTQAQINALADLQQASSQESVQAIHSMQVQLEEASVQMAAHRQGSSRTADLSDPVKKSPSEGSAPPSKGHASNHHPDAEQLKQADDFVPKSSHSQHQVIHEAAEDLGNESSSQTVPRGELGSRDLDAAGEAATMVPATALDESVGQALQMPATISGEPNTVEQQQQQQIEHLLAEVGQRLLGVTASQERCGGHAASLAIKSSSPCNK